MGYVLVDPTKHRTGR
ncbi:hypothetical protein BRAS3843_2120019 [Bradyrhizobium sp. STM 3843]|nr:hypothetical protein BRAS3843_2120019 [Bradyrhizobium sp. STM 3843]